VKGPGRVDLGLPPSDPEADWAVLIRRTPESGMAFPGPDWEERPPASQGVDPDRLAAAVDWLKGRSGRDGARELAVIRNGFLIWKGEDIDRLHGIWSCTKVFTSTVLGLLIDEGRCSLDTRAAEYVPQLAAGFPEVSLRHLTTMTSGYRAVGDEPQGGYLHGPSSTPFEPSPLPLFTPPGSRYAYWDSAMNLFGLVLTRIAGESMEDLFRRRIAMPIGMKGWEWGRHSLDDGMVVNGGSGNGDDHVFTSARELSRLGHLFLNHGNWSGRQLISVDWIRRATAVQAPATLAWAQPESGIDGRGAYGYNWWVNGVKPDGTRLWPGAPPGAFCAAGHNNNRLFVIPEWRMVITRMGLDQPDRKIEDRDWSEFLRRVGESLVR
jgi:CubicO group peptidase (beta-lactamase class C family)